MTRKEERTGNREDWRQRLTKRDQRGKNDKEIFKEKRQIKKRKSERRLATSVKKKDRRERGRKREREREREREWR